jgi:polyhydroxybutyrate depolymerase
LGGAVLGMKSSLLGIAITVVVVAGLIGIALAWFFYAPMPRASEVVGELRSVDVGGRARGYLVVTPPALKPNAPVLLVLHGSLMDGPKMRGMLGPRFERLARVQGAIVVYPSGVEGHFNEGRVTAKTTARTLNIDDVGFMRAIVETLAAAQGIDRQRVYAFGYSNGGAMALRLAAEAPDLLAGVIVACGNVPTPDNMDWKMQPGHTAVVLLAGTKDPIVPYDGGRVTIFGFGDRGTVLSAPASARWFAQRNGLATEPAADTTQHIGTLDVRQQDWGNPARVRLVTMQGAGHTVPQPDYRFPRFLGATVADDTILDAAWQLIDRR